MKKNPRSFLFSVLKMPFLPDTEWRREDCRKNSIYFRSDFKWISHLAQTCVLSHLVLFNNSHFFEYFSTTIKLVWCDHPFGSVLGTDKISLILFYVSYFLAIKFSFQFRFISLRNSSKSDKEPESQEMNGFDLAAADLNICPWWLDVKEND